MARYLGTSFRASAMTTCVIFMKQVVDRIYTVLLRSGDPEFVERMDNYARRTTAAWDIPNNLAN
jgi:hypothetical protein